MNKKISLSLAAMLAMATAAVGQTLPATTVNVVGNLSTSTQSRQVETPFWTKKMAEISNGSIKAQFRAWNELGLKGPEVFKLLAAGSANIATAQLGHHSGSDPINDGNDLAGMSDSFDSFKRVSDAFFPILSGYYKSKLGLHLISLQSYQSQVTFCRVPVSGLADFAGKRIRTSGASQADFVKYLKGEPVDMAFGDVQQSLEQGVIDCAITSAMGGYTARWYEGAKYLYSLPINFGAGATAANATWWDRQPAEIQTFLTAELGKLSDEMWAQNRTEDAAGIACNTEGPCALGEPARLTLAKPSEADVALRKEAFTNAVLPGWTKRCGEVCQTAFDTSLAAAAGMR
ncbi:TRAP-type C4-dicarboxylate transport system substrate-binding protein [Neorhizobium galegae]|uniref:TRAP transporter substrate-binding protein DctP n=1 Tax=Neorhizobium galegae TaxID=399 RepID=UPI001AE29EFE|nr:TRAP transporter substrate-binding protein DctP [Neorhizobium galegae]MBP2551442.1 TRAP-type C4-dicarboxylate transport system substrate-binding protein [Neorhizobium galegae]